jgi:hypothetical protein
MPLRLCRVNAGAVALTKPRVLSSTKCTDAYNVAEMDAKTLVTGEFRDNQGLTEDTDPSWPKKKPTPRTSTKVARASAYESLFLSAAYCSQKIFLLSSSTQGFKIGFILSVRPLT